MANSQEKNLSLKSVNFKKMIGGSIVSYAGNNAMSFVLGFYVLDISDSVLLFGIYLFLYSFSRVVVPIIAGPFLDRFSRKKMIYVLDFTSAALFFSIWLRMGSGSLSYFELYLITFLIGTIDSIYKVATNSLFPLLVDQEDLSKAYSILTNIEMIALLAVPVSMVIYKSDFSRAVFLLGAALFLTAAIIETTIQVNESHLRRNVSIQEARSQFVKDTREGINFLLENKAYLYVIIVCFFYNILFGVLLTVELPFFQRMSPENGYILYIVVYGASMAGRFISNSALYAFKVKKSLWFNILLLSVALFSIADAVFMLTPIVPMVIIQAISGFFIGIYHNFRKTTIQSKLDNDCRARYCGMELMVDNAGVLLGDLYAGFAESVISIPAVVAIPSILNMVAFFAVFLGFGRKALKKLFNE